MTITEFLLARIAEDEASMDDALWYTRPDGSRIKPRIDDEPVERSKARIFRREMAECEAKRRIVGFRGAIGLPEDGSVRPGEGMTYLDGAHAAVAAERERIMRLLALPYADHPDYDEAWAL